MLLRDKGVLQKTESYIDEIKYFVETGSFGFLFLKIYQSFHFRNAKSGFGAFEYIFN